MAKKKRKYLHLTKCILEHDVRCKDSSKRFKSIRGLAIHIREDNPMLGSLSSIYTKLYRYEKDGFVNQPLHITNIITELLDTSEDKLIRSKKP